MSRPHRTSSVEPAVGAESGAGAGAGDGDGDGDGASAGGSASVGLKRVCAY
jgi:hypothetical protein